MSKYHISSAIFTLFFLISCSGSTNQFIDENYSNGEKTGSISLLTIQKNEFEQEFTDHSFGTLRPNETQLFKDFINEFSKGGTDHANGMITQFDPSDFERREFETDVESFNSLTPSVGTTLNDVNQESRYVIIIDRYFFEQYEDAVGGNTYAGHEKEIIPRLKFNTNYVIWDNNVGDAIAWGAVEADRRIELSRIEEVYDEILTESFQKMLSKSPVTGSI